METQTVTLTKREAAMKMSLDMIREWCCSNLKGKKAVKIAISCGKKRYEFLADHTGFVLKGKNNPDYYYTKSKVDMKIAKKEHVYPLVPFLTVGYIITLIILIIQGQHISWLL